MIDERLSELGSGPARFQARRAADRGAEPGHVLRPSPTRPVKLAGFAFAFEALESGAYELLGPHRPTRGRHADRRARRPILAEEHAAAEHVAATWDAAVDAVARETVGV